MALQPNYILAEQRAGMGPPFRKNQNQIKKISSVAFRFSSEALYLGISSPKMLSKCHDGKDS